VIGAMLQAGAYFRQKAAQIRDGHTQRLAMTAAWGSVVFVDGVIIPVPFAEYTIFTPSNIGRASDLRIGLPDIFYCTPTVKNRRRFAHARITVENSLHKPPTKGLVPPSDKNKKHGWAECEQRNLSKQLRFAQGLLALRRAVKPLVNRHFTARGQGCLALSSSMATRLSGRLLGPRPTYFIARPDRATADRATADWRYTLTFQDNRSLAGLIRHAQRAAMGPSAHGGVLRSQHLQSPISKSKDTSCSTRS
jgi:hypothetical protein